MPRLSSVFIMLLLTLFSFYLQFIVYPQSIILVLMASPLLPTSTKSYSMLCSHHNYYIIIFALWFNLSLSASFPLPRFKHDPTSWEETSQPRTLPSLLATHPAFTSLTSIAALPEGGSYVSCWTTFIGKLRGWKTHSRSQGEWLNASWPSLKPELLTTVISCLRLFFYSR